MLLEFSVVVRAFVIGLSQISFFLQEASTGTQSPLTIYFSGRSKKKQQITTTAPTGPSALKLMWHNCTRVHDMWPFGPSLNKVRQYTEKIKAYIIHK